MKRILSLLLLLIASGSVTQAAAPDTTVVERGPHHAIWQRVTESKTPWGRTYLITNSYRELSIGKHYLKNEQWVPSVLEISVLPSGFGVATQLQHKIIFAPNVNSAGAVDCLTPDDKRLRHHVLGLAYMDKVSGQGVMIASLKDSIGIVAENNQVVYPDAFESEGEFRADIRYRITLAGIEQDIILVERPPSPLLYGILPENCRLEVYSEFVESPPVSKTAVSTLAREPDPVRRQAMVEPDLVDETLVFGGVMRMSHGVAFRLGQTTDESEVPMGKTWEQREGRQLLVERVDFKSIESELGRLPEAAQVQQPKKLLPLKGAGPNAAWASFLPRRPPAAHAAVRKLRTQQMAKLELPQQGFVLDYVLLTAETNDFTFKGDETFYASGQVILAGNTVLEGGAVIKCASGTLNKRIAIQGTLDCRTSPFRPAIFTGKDDDTVGQTISGSTGAPGTNEYGQMFDITGTTNAIDLHDVAIRYAYYALNVGARDLTLTHAQIGPSFAAIVAPGGKVRVRNALIFDCRDTIFGGSLASGFPQGEHVTFHSVNKLRSSSTPKLTNCLMIAVTNNLVFTGINNETNINDSGVFQTAGSGARYLADNSPYRDIGTTAINADLLTAIRVMTTRPPLIANDTVGSTISADTVLTPQAERDTDIPDLGFHYPAADWLVGGLSVTGATLRVKGGATIAINCTNTDWGIRLESGAHLISEGDPLNLNRFVRTHSFQEVPAGTGTSTTPLFADTHPAPEDDATLSLRFTDIPQIQRHYAFRQVNQMGTFNSIVIRDSQFRGGANYFSQNVTNQFMAWTNVLFADSFTQLYPYTPTTVHMRNCTFASATSNLLWLYVIAGSTWSVKDCIFANVAVTNFGAGSISNNYNGYLTNASRLVPTAANDTVLATNTANFQTGTLGSLYLPSGSGFVDKGSVTNAGFVGLWHYTTQTSQTKDAGSILDLGFHYMALSGGAASDADGEGLADYIEDADGDGIKDDAESNWADAYTDTDGVDDYTEYLQGRNPLAISYEDTNAVVNLKIYTPLK